MGMGSTNSAPGRLWVKATNKEDYSKMRAAFAEWHASYEKWKAEQA